MPIIYIHGVATRNETDWLPIEAFLRRYVAQVLNPTDPAQVVITSVFWGDVGAQFAWSGKSRPRTRLLKQGIGHPVPQLSPDQRAQLLADFPLSLPKQSASLSSRLSSGKVTVAVDSAVTTLRLKNLNRSQLSDLLATVAYQPQASVEQHGWAAMAADDVAHYDGQTSYEGSTPTDIFEQLGLCVDSTEETALIQRLVTERYQQLERKMRPTAGQGVGWLTPFKDRLDEAMSRANQSAGYALSQLVGEARPRLNEFITLFLGDVFTYLSKRGTVAQPGAIVQRLLDSLLDVQQKANQEPLVVLSHSMGGQIVYDTITSFLPHIPACQQLKVDFWCATASQVGLFEEMKLFAASDGRYSEKTGICTPFPDRNHLGYWWNVWDANDFLSYTAAGIFEGIDDEAYDSGMSLLNAHSGYLQRPSFYRKLALKLQTVL